MKHTQHLCMRVPPGDKLQAHSAPITVDIRMKRHIEAQQVNHEEKKER
jgi:hypothetical protein